MGRKDLMKKSNFNTSQEKKYLLYITLAVLLGILLVSLIVSVSIGQVKIPFSEAFKIVLFKLTGIELSGMEGLISGPKMDIIWQIRLPRTIMAMLVGAGLSICGAVMQASVQNPLADPYILGISSGASLGATFAILMGITGVGVFSKLGVAFWAFLGALAASFLVLSIASIGGKISSVKLILAGTVTNAICSSFSNFIIYFSNDAEGMKSVAFWTMGSLTASKWSSLPLIAGIVVISTVFFLSQSRNLNVMLVGDDAAITLGNNLSLSRRIYMIITSITTAVLVSACGIIGFVGLIIPHIVRGLLGSDHKRLMPVAIISGAIFLVWTDLIARTIIHNGELPIGIITSLFGAPLFTYILIKKNYGFGGR